MRLTLFTDYSLRLLMFAATHRDRLVTIEETAKTFNISRAHLMKVANLLTSKGYLEAVRGRSGGLRLIEAPERICLGDVIRATEPDFALVECFDRTNNCRITPRCRLRGVISDALAAFLDVFDRHTLADLLINPANFGLPRRPPIAAPASSGL